VTGRLSLAIAVLLAVGGLEPAGAANQPRPRAHDPTELWSEFPLEQGRPEPSRARPAPPSRPRSQPRREPAALETESSDSVLPLQVGIALAGTLLLALMLTLWPGRRRDRRRPTENATVERSPPVSMPPETTTPGQVDRRPGYADLGERVAGVLSAAEAAAQRIRTEAQRDAERVRVEADSYARVTRQAAEDTARRVEAEARRRQERLQLGAQEAFRQMTSRLDELLEAPSTQAPSTSGARTEDRALAGTAAGVSNAPPSDQMQ
jgi:cell division septum initiation protein DivIVA